MIRAEGPPILKLQDIPEELLFMILCWVEDLDLQTGLNVSRLLRRLSSDIILVKHLLRRNSSRLEARLYTGNPQRPSREDLVTLNIIKGPTREHMRRILATGGYLGSPTLRALLEARKGLENWSRKRNLTKRIEARLNIQQLSERNVIPREALPKSSTTHGAQRTVIQPTLLPKVMLLRKALTRNALNKALTRRMKSEDWEASDLNQMHRIIAPTSSLAPKLAKTAFELNQRLRNRNASEGFKKRAKLEALQETKILPEIHIAALICPNIRSKINIFEHGGLPSPPASPPRK
ncbi:hypothetical protein SmJEL517_g00505 [Synchytrium microbalum]|uniref:F-box domain-containing protein n=1 Tax=Synchytrium microbalum TaxID=1806994 RepID=A0A507CHH0_9FUNG|nr:uncharacterized protein SmJEL517_g00505 [Synchytrium microbalum]TPX37526.1 hypothetical protein SmJEL517_g00505 [Synchytrium microbalum]